MSRSVKKIWPKISVITPSLNHGDFIEKTIQSISKQGYFNFEHIIVDGFSTDKTADVVARYPHLIFIQEKSTAVEAQNIGLKEATGDIICFLNADDFYTSQSFFLIIQKFREDPYLDIVCGHFQILQENKIISKSAFPSQRMSFESISFYAPGINSMFFKKKFIQNVGSINPSYTRANDREYLFRCVLNKCKWHQISDIVIIYRLHDASYTINKSVIYDSLIVKEHIQLVNELLHLEKLSFSQRHILKAWGGFEKVRELFINLKEKKIQTFLINLSAFIISGAVFNFIFLTLPLYARKKIFEYLIQN